MPSINNKVKTHINIMLIAFLVIASMFVTSGISVSYAASKSKAPVISNMVSTDSYVKLTWKNGNKSGVRAHYIYRKEGKGSYKRIGKVKKKTSSFTDDTIKLGTKYYYKVSNKKVISNKYSKARSVTPVKIKAPKLSNLKTYSNGNRRVAQLTWTSAKGKMYYVYRKPKSGSWKKLATVTAKGESASYTDNTAQKNTPCVYTCKEVRKISSILYKYGSYDEGISVFMTKPEVKLDAQNLKSVLTWDAIDGADEYYVYRKFGKNGSYRCIGTTANNIFTDVYDESVTSNERSKYMCATSFIDPSVNMAIYTVRAVSKTDGKYSYSDYNVGGVFHIETPSIVSVTKTSATKATIDWGTVKHADAYYIYSGYRDDSGIHWTKVGTFKSESGNRMKKSVEVDSNHNLFTVQAKFTMDGKTLYSDYDEGFDISNRNYSSSTVLFFGNSITYGSPYKGTTTREVFSYPWRVQQLTNIKMYNPSIPGATYHDSTSDSRYRMVTEVADVIKEGKTPKNPNSMRHNFDENTRKFEDFDVVVMACGTNDYLDDAKLGDLDSTDRTEFNGSINQVMSYIKEGNEIRAQRGKAPIKIVFVEMFYSDRTNEPYVNLHNRFKTKNGIGLTLTDYQDDLNKLTEKYKVDGFDIYNFDTTEFVNEDTCPYVTSDNLHMSRYTYTQIGNKLSNYLITEKII